MEYICQKVPSGLCFLPSSYCVALYLLTFLAQALTNHCFVQQGDILKTNVDLEDFHDDFVDLLKEPVRNKQVLFSEEKNKVKKTM